MLPSERQFRGLDRAPQRSWIKGAGFIQEELEHPLVGVVNTYQDLAPENVHLRAVADAVKAVCAWPGGPRWNSTPSMSQTERPRPETACGTCCPAASSSRTWSS